MKKIAVVAIGSASVLGTFALGVLVGKKAFQPKIEECGNLRIDTSETDEDPKMFLEITNEKKLMNSKYITLTVIRENYVSHKN